MMTALAPASKAAAASAGTRSLCPVVLTHSGSETDLTGLF